MQEDFGTLNAIRYGPNFYFSGFYFTSIEQIALCAKLIFTISAIVVEKWPRSRLHLWSILKALFATHTLLADLQIHFYDTTFLFGGWSIANNDPKNWDVQIPVHC